MGKVGKLLPEEYKQKAIENNIPIPTVYGRLERNWDLERAVTELPKNIVKVVREPTGEIKASNRPKGDVFSVTLYKDLEPLFNQALEESGQSRSVFVADAIEQYLLKLWKPRNKKKNHRRTKTK
jgi:hypothetical protein